MTTIAIDGLSEEDFRRAIENRLREDRAPVAVERLQRLLEAYAGPGKVLPERFLTVTADDLELTGWENLGAVLESHDREGRPVSAMSITFGWPGEDVPRPDASGHLRPYIECGYYSDDAFPFSKSNRNDLLEGYSYHGCTWSADCEATDSAIGLEGIDDLQGALALLEADLLASEEPDEHGIRAGSLGACLLSVLLFQAVRDRIERDGLPRPLCVMAGSNDVYPYFDAPVVGLPDEVCKAAEIAEEAEPEYSEAIPAPRYTSLLMANIPRARKRMALVLDESEVETASRIAKLRGHDDADPLPVLPEPSFEPDIPAGTIVPIAGGPLLTKKPHGIPSDFRDLLGPREPLAPPPDFPPVPVDLGPPPPAPPSPEPPEPLPGPVFEPEVQAAVSGQAPAAVPPPAPLEETLQERLQALINARLAEPKAPAPAIEPEAESAPPEDMECIRFSATEWPERDAEPDAESWPEPEPEPRVSPYARLRPPVAAVPEKRGLIARLRKWWSGN